MSRDESQLMAPEFRKAVLGRGFKRAVESFFDTQTLPSLSGYNSRERQRHIVPFMDALALTRRSRGVWRLSLLKEIDALVGIDEKNVLFDMCKDLFDTGSDNSRENKSLAQQLSPLCRKARSWVFRKFQQELEGKDVVIETMGYCNTSIQKELVLFLEKNERKNKGAPCSFSSLRAVRELCVGRVFMKRESESSEASGAAAPAEETPFSESEKNSLIVFLIGIREFDSFKYLYGRLYGVLLPKPDETKDSYGVFKKTLQASLEESRSRGVFEAVSEITEKIKIVKNFPTGDALWNACRFGRTHDARKFIQHSDADAIAENGTTPLIIAAWSGYSRIVTLLLDSGVNMEKKFRENTAFSWALIKEHPEVAKLLIMKTAVITEMIYDYSSPTEPIEETPLYWACRKGYVGVVQALAKPEKQIELDETCHARTPLFQAVEAGHIGVVRALLSCSGRIDQANPSRLKKKVNPGESASANSVGAQSFFNMSALAMAKSRRDTRAIVLLIGLDHRHLSEGLLSFIADVPFVNKASLKCDTLTAKTFIFELLSLIHKAKLDDRKTALYNELALLYEGTKYDELGELSKGLAGLCRMARQWVLDHHLKADFTNIRQIIETLSLLDKREHKEEQKALIAFLSKQGKRYDFDKTRAVLCLYRKAFESTAKSAHAEPESESKAEPRDAAAEMDFCPEEIRELELFFRGINKLKFYAKLCSELGGDFPSKEVLFQEAADSHSSMSEQYGSL